MSQHCHNRLTVKNHGADFLFFLADGFSFENIFPVKNVAKKLEAQENLWGTRYDLEEEVQKEVATQLTIDSVAEFDTVLSPPYGVIERLSEKFPNAEFTLEYYDIAGSYSGTFKSQAGISYDDYTTDEEDVKDFVFEVFDFDMDEVTYDGEESDDEDEEDEEEPFIISLSQQNTVVPCLSSLENNLFDPEDGE